MNQMLNYANGLMSAGMEILPLAWVLTLSLLGVLIRKKSKTRQTSKMTGEKGLRLR